MFDHFSHLKSQVCHCLLRTCATVSNKRKRTSFKKYFWYWQLTLSLLCGEKGDCFRMFYWHKTHEKQSSSLSPERSLHHSTNIIIMVLVLHRMVTVVVLQHNSDSHNIPASDQKEDVTTVTVTTSLHFTEQNTSYYNTAVTLPNKTHRIIIIIITLI